MDLAALSTRRLLQLLRSTSKVDSLWYKPKIIKPDDTMTGKDLWRCSLTFLENGHCDQEFSQLLSEGFEHIDYNRLSCRDMAQLAEAICKNHIERKESPLPPEEDGIVGLQLLSYVGIVFTNRAQESKTEDLIMVSSVFAELRTGYPHFM